MNYVTSQWDSLLVLHFMPLYEILCQVLIEILIDQMSSRCLLHILFFFILRERFSFFVVFFQPHVLSPLILPSLLFLSTKFFLSINSRFQTKSVSFRKNRWKIDLRYTGIIRNLYMSPISNWVYRLMPTGLWVATI